MQGECRPSALGRHGDRDRGRSSSGRAPRWPGVGGAAAVGVQVPSIPPPDGACASQGHVLGDVRWPVSLTVGRSDLTRQDPVRLRDWHCIVCWLCVGLVPSFNGRMAGCLPVDAGSTPAGIVTLLFSPVEAVGRNRRATDPECVVRLHGQAPRRCPETIIRPTSPPPRVTQQRCPLRRPPATRCPPARHPTPEIKPQCRPYNAPTLSPRAPPPRSGAPAQSAPIRAGSTPAARTTPTPPRALPWTTRCSSTSPSSP